MDRSTSAPLLCGGRRAIPVDMMPEPSRAPSAVATEHPARPYRYWAFISYSDKDEAFAKRLRAALETYRVPKVLVTNSIQRGFCDRALAAYPGEIVQQRRTRDYRFAFYRLAQPDARGQTWGQTWGQTYAPRGQTWGQTNGLTPGLTLRAVKDRPVGDDKPVREAAGAARPPDLAPGTRH